MAPATTFVGYAPSLVYSYGYDRLKSNALVTIGVWLLLCTTVAWGYLADRLRKRGPMVTSGLVILWGFTVCLFPSPTLELSPSFECVATNDDG